MILVILQSCICLTLFALFYKATLNSENDFVVNRFFLIFAPALSVLIPLLDIEVGLSSAFWDPYVELTNFSNGIVLDKMILDGIYFLGLLSTLIYQLIKLSYIKERLIPQLAKSRSPFSFMGEIHFDNDENLESEENRAIKFHEQAHQYLGHHYDILALSIFKAVFWFFPVIHLFERWLKQVHEFQADLETLAVISRSKYKRLVVLKGLKITKDFQVSQFGSSSIHKRIKMMSLLSYQPKRSKLFLLLPFIVTLMVAFSFNYSFQPSHAEVLTVQMRPIEFDQNYFSLTDDEVIGFFNGRAIIIQDLENSEKREQAIKLMLNLNGTFDR